MEIKVMKHCSIAFLSINQIIYTPLNAIHFEVCLPVGMMPQHQLKTLCNAMLIIICLHKTHQMITVMKMVCGFQAKKIP